jgi:hypothetical protein
MPNATEFLDNWLASNIKAVPYGHQKEYAKHLTELCSAEAESAGITNRELHEAAGGNLKRRIDGALEDAQDVVVRKRAKKNPS